MFELFLSVQQRILCLETVFRRPCQYFWIALKVILSLSHRYKIFTSDWLWIDVCHNAVLVKSISLWRQSWCSAVICSHEAFLKCNSNSSQFQSFFKTCVKDHGDSSSRLLGGGIWLGGLLSGLGTFWPTLTIKQIFLKPLNRFFLKFEILMINSHLKTFFIAID